MNKETLLGIITGIIVAIIIYKIAIKATKKYRFGNNPQNYDERQKAEQGQAYKVGFFSVMLYAAIVGSAEIFLKNGLPVEAGVTAYCAIFIGAFAFATYAIFHNSYISINENSTRIKIIFLIIGFMNIVVSIVNIINGTIIENGLLTLKSTNLFCGLLMVALPIEIFIKEKLDEKGTTDEES